MSSTFAREQADNEMSVRARMMAKRPYAGMYWPPWEPLWDGDGEPSRKCPRCGNTLTVFQCLRSRVPAARGMTLWGLYCFTCRDTTNAFDCRHFLCAATCKNAGECDNVRYYDIGGRRYPSVTSILAYLPDPPALAHWKATNPAAERIFCEAATVGTLTHYRIENHLAKRVGLPLQRFEISPGSPPITTAMKDRVVRNFAAFLELDEIHHFKPLAIEQTVNNPMLEYAGTVDMICLTDDGHVLVDIKTGKSLYEKYLAQLWAYAEALSVMGQPVSRCAVLRLGERDYEYSVVDTDPDLFFRAFEIYQSQKIKK